MAIFCPNKKDKDFQKMVDIFGEDLAYYLWNKNKGNPIHLTPSGEKSTLYQSLLDKLGDERIAAQMKSKIFTRAFKEKYGDWEKSGIEPDFDLLLEAPKEKTTEAGEGVELGKITEPEKIKEITPKGFRQSERAKINKKLKIEPRAIEKKDIAWDEELPLSEKEDPNYKASDLNNALSLRNIGRQFVQDMGKTVGEQVRPWLVSRFSRKARAIFNPQSGIIRVRNISDVDDLAHEMGHWIDAKVFNIRGILGDKAKIMEDSYADVVELSKIKGVKYKNKTYRSKEKILQDKERGIISEDKSNDLIKELFIQLDARDKRLIQAREKYGNDIVDGIIQRDILKKEIKEYLKNTGYPSKEITEGIAEFIKDYCLRPEVALENMPAFHAWFEKLLDNAPSIKEGLLNLRKNFELYDKLDPRYKTLLLFAEKEKKPSFLEGLVKLDEHEFTYSFVNHLQYHRDLSKMWKAAVGSDYESYRDPYLAAKSYLGIDGRAKQCLLYHPYGRKGNDIIIKKDVEGLIPILSEITGTEKYEDYQGYMLAKDSIESYKNNKPEQAAMSLEQAKESVELWGKKYGKEQLEDFQKRVQKYNEALVDFAVECNKISKEVSEKIKELHHYYCPLSRVLDEYELVKGNSKYTDRVLAMSGKSMWSRKGSKAPIQDIFESMIENTYRIYATGERNILLRNIRDSLFDIQKYNQSKGIDQTIIEEIPSKVIIPYYDITTGKKRYSIQTKRPLSGRILDVWEDGKVKYYDVSKEFYDPLFQQEARVTELIRVLSIPSRWLQAGAVVYDPTFPVRNIVRDQISALFYSKYNYLPTDFVKGLCSAIKRDDYYQKWLASGGDQSFLVAADEMLAKKYTEQKVGRLLDNRFKTYKRNPLIALQDFSRASEIGTRVGAFRNALKKTDDVWKAAEESRDISADYGIHGAAVRQYLPMFPFLNARVQHARSIVEATHRPANFFIKGMAITAPAVMNWLINNKDKESQDLYQSLPTWRRLGLFNIRIPGTEHFFPLPKGFFGVLFGTSTEALLDYTLTHDDRVADNLLKQLFSEFSPIGNVTEIVPHFARPQIEVWANKKSYTGKPIVTESLKYVEPAEQYYSTTPEIYKKIGQALNWSPVKIDHYVRSYTGGAGMGAVNILDETLQLIGVVEKKPEDTFTALSKLPLFKAFLTEKPIGMRSSYVEDFYKKLDDIEKINHTINVCIADNNYKKIDKILADPENRKMYSFYEANSTAINEFRKALYFLRDGANIVKLDNILTEKERQKEIDKINNIIQGTSLRFKQAWDNMENGKEENAIFDLGKEMDELIKKMKLENKDYEKELLIQKSNYNPYWIQVKKSDSKIYDLLKQYGGLREIPQKRSITIGLEKKELEWEDVRVYNEKVVKEYVNNVKSFIGNNENMFESKKKMLHPEAGKPEQTELEYLFDFAWKQAGNKVKAEFLVK